MIYEVKILAMAELYFFTNWNAVVEFSRLRAVAAYMCHGNNNITIHKQITVTPLLFTL